MTFLQFLLIAFIFAICGFFAHHPAIFALCIAGFAGATICAAFALLPKARRLGEEV